jgi:hypothetical protein
MQRYSKACPACGKVIRYSEMLGSSFPCPACHEWLELDSKFLPVMVVSGVMAFALCYAPYRHSGFPVGGFPILVAFATVILGLAVAATMGLFGWIGLKQSRGKPFDNEVSLHLTDSAETNEKTTR